MQELSKGEEAYAIAKYANGLSIKKIRGRTTAHALLIHDFF